MQSRQQLELATSIADGEPVDWQAVADSNATPRERRVLEALLAISEISEAHEAASSLGLKSHTEPDRLRSSDLKNWGPLEILGVLGAGSCGRIYQARDPQLDRIVALKLLDRTHRGSDAKQAVVEEGRLLAKIKHSNVATVYGADRHQDQVGIWMEFIRGSTLDEIITSRGPLGAKEATLVGIDLCQALAAVHKQGILHRDIKAQNVMREEGGRIVLVDFGIGQEVSAEAQEPALSGTPLYMAPELVSGGPASEQSDIYALGVLLYHLVTGSFPLAGRSLAEIRSAHTKGLLAPLRAERPELPRNFVSIVEKALAVDPADRHASAAQLEDDLAALLAVSEPTPFRNSTQLPRTIRRLAVTLGLAALLAGLTLAAGWWRSPCTQARRAHTKALELRKGGDLDAAVIHLESATERCPEFARAWSTLADYYEGQGRYSKALAAAEESFAGSDELPEYDRQMIRGAYFSTTQQIGKALNEYHAAATLSGRRLAEPWLQTAQQQSLLGRSSDAVDSLRKALAFDPDNPFTQGLLAVLLAEAGRPDEALEAVQRGRDIAPNHPYLYWGEGLAFLVRGDTSAARSAFEQLAQGGPTYSSFGQLYLAQALIYEGALEQAAFKLEGTLALDHQENFDNTAGLRRIRLAQIQLLLDRNGDALTSLRQAEKTLQHVPAFVENIRDIALVYADLDQLEDLERLLDTLKRIESKYPGPLSTSSVYLLGGELARLDGRVEQAEVELRRARVESSDPVTTDRLARILVEQEEYEEAIELWRGLLAEKGRIMRWHSATLWVLAHRDLSDAFRKLAAEQRSNGQRVLAVISEERAQRAFQGYADAWGAANLPIRRQSVRTPSDSRPR